MSSIAGHMLEEHRIKNKEKAKGDFCYPHANLLNVILRYDTEVKSLDAANNCSALHYCPDTGYWSQLNQDTASHEPLNWASLLFTHPPMPEQFWKNLSNLTRKTGLYTHQNSPGQTQLPKVV